MYLTHIKRNMLEKDKGGTLEKTLNLKQPSLAITAHLKIDATCTHCNTIDTFYLENECKIERERPLRPFATQAMLAQQWRKLSTC
jgi:hypothetical protein